VYGTDESYTLAIAEDGLDIEANTEWGVLHALETLLQLADSEPGGWRFPRVRITDHPAYPWRGLMLDTARHWMSPARLRAVVDGMASLKMNILHLHLTDDQAFRLEIAALPDLARQSGDGHFLTRTEAVALVAYAADRGIRIVPEIDMPGHVTAWLSACPGLATRPGAYQPSRRFGPHPGCLNPHCEHTYTVVRKILTEVAEIFPDNFVHVGGDEVSADVLPLRPQAMSTEVPGELAPQALFTRRIAAILDDLGRQPVGWDEIMHPHLPRRTVVQCWRSGSIRDAILAAGHPVILSYGYYLDLNFPAQTHYRFDPCADSCTLQRAATAMFADIDDDIARQAAQGLEARFGLASRPPARWPGLILGGEACLWSELIDESHLDTRIFSRLPAIAERLWSGGRELPVAHLYRRLPTFWIHLENTTALRPVSAIPAQLRAIGVPDACIPAARTLLAVLEPVRWYRRLLGDAAIRARAANTPEPADRPYDADTSLDRLVDICPPESLEARSFLELAVQFRRAPGATPAYRALQRFASQWRIQFATFDTITPPVQQIREVLPLSRLLSDSAGFLEDLLQAHLAGGVPETLRARLVHWLPEADRSIAELRLTTIAGLKHLAGIP